MHSLSIEVVVGDADGVPSWMEARTRRSLGRAGFPVAAAAEGSGLLWLRAGAWFVSGRPLAPPPSPGQGRGLLAFGLCSSGVFAPGLAELMARSGGRADNQPLPPLVSLYADAPAVRRLGRDNLLQLARHGQAAGGEEDSVRRVHWADLDADHDEDMRVLQICTSLQTGGAERIALDLTRHLPRQGVATRLITLGRPLRQAYPSPPGHADLSGLDRPARAAAVGGLAARFGADLIHGHLLDAGDARAFARHGVPLVLTVHNTRAGWPQGLETLAASDCRMLIACSLAVEEEVRERLPHLRVRTAWNGVDVRGIAGRVAELRGRRAKSGDEWVIACVANPRPQKRLHLLPGILAATRNLARRMGLARRIRMVIAGEVSPRSPDAVQCRRQVDQEAERLGVSILVEWTEGRIPVEQVLAGAHALVSCSLHEGLSLAQLEGIAAGLPLVASEAGGTREIAEAGAPVRLLPLEAGPERYAEALCAALEESPRGSPELRHFTLDAMCRRHAGLYASALATGGREPADGVAFVTNNLSTGGAQSSLRRLAGALHAQGVRVGVTVLQEDPGFPTPGRLDLASRGVPVSAISPDDDPLPGLRLLLDQLARAKPRVVVLWNVMPVWKVLLADLLPDLRLVDVSPGEMYFASLARYFAEPLAGLPCRASADYGRRLAAVVVKFGREAETARALLGAPVEVIPNGVPLPEPVARVPGPVLRLGTAARLSPQKRLEDLLAAFRLALPRLPPCELRIAGKEEPGGAEYARCLRESARDLPVRWLGEPETMAGFYAGLDLFLQISEPAGCPNASLEAMATGLPVIATDAGGAGEQVVSGTNGCLVPARDAGAFAAALVSLSRDPALRESMGAAARAHVSRHFSLEIMTSRYRSLFFPPAPENPGCPAASYRAADPPTSPTRPPS